MADGSVMAAMMFTVIMAGASIVIPFSVLYWAARKKETGVPSSFGLGLLAYFWSQFLLPIPVIWILSKIPGFMTIFVDEKWHVPYLMLTAVILASLASLGRVWCIWLMNRRVPSLYRALSSAAGFAAFKAVSVLASYLSYYNYLNTYNTQGREGLRKLITVNGISAESAENMIDSLLEARSFDAAMEGVNVVLALAVEAALVVVIYEGYIRKKTVKAAAVSGALGCAYSFAGMIINALGTDKLGGVLEPAVCSIIYDAYMLACALASAWLVTGAVRRYRMVLAEGPYAHFAYFEKNDDKKTEIKSREKDGENNGIED